MRVNRKRLFALAGATLLATTTVFAASTAYADPGGTITGHVLDNGVPVPDVSVQAMADDGSGWLPPIMTDASGAFTIANVPANLYRVSYLLPATPRSTRTARPDSRTRPSSPLRMVPRSLWRKRCRHTAPSPGG